MRKFEYRIRIVLFGLTINIPNTKYRIVYKILRGKATKIIMFVSYWTICLNNFWNYSDRFSDRYSNTRILFGVPKKRLSNTKYQILLRYWDNPNTNMNTTIGLNYSNIIWIPNNSSHPSWNQSDFLPSAVRCPVPEYIRYIFHF